MARRSYAPERIINKLREVEILLSQESTVGEAARKIGATEQTYYRWGREYGGMRIDEFKQPKEPEPGRLIIRAGQREPCLDQELVNPLYNGI